MVWRGSYGPGRSLPRGTGQPLIGLLGLTVISGYLFAYTPLKTRTSLCKSLQD